MVKARVPSPPYRRYSRGHLDVARRQVEVDERGESFLDAGEGVVLVLAAAGRAARLLTERENGILEGRLQARGGARMNGAFGPELGLGLGSMLGSESASAL